MVPISAQTIQKQGRKFPAFYVNYMTRIIFRSISRFSKTHVRFEILPFAAINLKIDKKPLLIADEIKLLAQHAREHEQLAC